MCNVGRVHRFRRIGLRFQRTPAIAQAYRFSAGRQRHLHLLDCRNHPLCFARSVLLASTRYGASWQFELQVTVRTPPSKQELAMKQSWLHHTPYLCLVEVHIPDRERGPHSQPALSMLAFRPDGAESLRESGSRLVSCRADDQTSPGCPPRNSSCLLPTERGTLFAMPSRIPSLTTRRNSCQPRTGRNRPA